MAQSDKSRQSGLHSTPTSQHVVWHQGSVDANERFQALGQEPVTIWFTGLSGAGKSTIACQLERRLVASGHFAFVLDGDNLRHGLNRDLGFSAEARRENIRRTAEVARLMNDAGLIVITAFISPAIADRELAKTIIGEQRFIEVFVDTPLDVCEARDVKGLYKMARSGSITEFTGISAPYEAPVDPDIRISPIENIIEASELVLQYLVNTYASMRARQTLKVIGHQT